MIGENQEKKVFYFKSEPPTNGYLYHYSTYQGLKGIVTQGAISAMKAYSSSNNRVIHLTTAQGKFDSCNPASVPRVIAGFVEIPYKRIENLAVPCLYRTFKDIPGRVFTNEPPLEYKYIAHKVTHPAMFIDENEYAVLEEYLNIYDCRIFVRPERYDYLLRTGTLQRLLKIVKWY